MINNTITYMSEYFLSLFAGVDLVAGLMIAAAIGGVSAVIAELAGDRP